MAEGFKAILKMAAPPVAEYHSGASVIIQGDSLKEVEEVLDSYVGEGVGATLLRHLVEVNLQGAVQRALQGAPSLEPTGPQDVDAPAPTGDGEVASVALLKAASKKTGRPVEDLAGISKTEAMGLMKGKG